MIKLSERPEDPDWEPSDRECECGSLMWSCGWWDDTPEMGGACIGTAFKCGDCGDYYTD